MAENKTKPTNESVQNFLNSIQPESKRKDCKELVKLMQKVSGNEPVMWGKMVGFGNCHYKYESGREGNIFMIGFAPRAKNISVYSAAYDDLLDKKKQQLGKVKLGKSCIYINKLEDVDKGLLEEILTESIELTLKRYPWNKTK